MCLLRKGRNEGERRTMLLYVANKAHTLSAYSSWTQYSIYMHELRCTMAVRCGKYANSVAQGSLYLITSPS